MQIVLAIIALLIVLGVVVFVHELVPSMSGSKVSAT